MNVSIESICRDYTLMRSFTKVANRHGITRSIVKRLIIEVRSLGVKVALGIPTKLNGYVSKIINPDQVDVFKLNTIVKIAKRVRRIKKNMIQLKCDGRDLRLKAKQTSKNNHLLVSV